ncbi:MAG TPA: DUF3618 domain-containing protein [Stellaceae bacterium]|nr:DUF3618 domain-containing protein [Stellaceae bacterium]
MAHGYADGPHRSAIEIEQDIGRTRAELGLTLDALRNKLTARNIVKRGIDMAKSISDENRVSIGFDGFRADPVALTLIGVGIAWFLASNTGVLDTVAQDERVQAARQRIANMTGIGGTTEGQGPEFGGPALAADERNRTGGWVHQATDAARGAIRAVRDTAGEYTGRPAGWLRDKSRTALDQAGGYAGYAGEQASHFGGRMTGIFDRHPLMIGAIGLIVGAVVASFLPSTRTEDRWMGESRDEALRRASDLGREAIQRVRHNIDDSIDRATGEPASDATAF